MTSSTTATRLESVTPGALGEFLRREREVVIDRAVLDLARFHGAHYEAADTERRLVRLYDHVVAAAGDRDLGPIVTYAQGLAEERYAAGYALAEVQTAFNALEEALWRELVHGLSTDEVPGALTLVSAIFGAAKDTLACSYLAAVTRTAVPVLDLESLAVGTSSA